MEQEEISDSQLRLKIKEQRKRVQDFGHASDKVVAKEWKTLQDLEAELKKREDLIKAQAAPKRLLYYLKNNPVVTAILVAFVLVILASVARAGFEKLEERANQNRPQISQLIGMKLSEMEQLLDENGVKYGYDGDIFDENAKDEQTVTYVSRLYSKNSETKVDNSRRLLKGDKVIIFTAHTTDAQQEQIDSCEAMGSDYFYSFSHGKVNCKLTDAAKLRREKELCAKKDRMVWYSDSVGCITEKEAERRQEEEAEAKRKAEEEEQRRKDEEAEEERKAAEEAARIEAEERAEEERKAAEEAAKKAEEERRKAEEDAKRAEEEKAANNVTPSQPQVAIPTPQPAPSTSTPSTSTPQTTPSTSSNPYYVHGYCKDGAPAYGNPSDRGKANACYGHGGWRDEY